MLSDQTGRVTRSSVCRPTMNQKSRSVTCFFGDKYPINCANLVPPRPLTKPIELKDDLRFLVLDVNARDTNYTHWISPDTTDRTILELHSLLYLLNRIFYHADKKCCLFVQQKERLVPGNLLLRKEIVAGHLLYFGFARQVFEELLPTCLTLALMINANISMPDASLSVRCAWAFSRPRQRRSTCLKK